MKTIELAHWTKGGTGVTNVTDDSEVYEEAVREYNDPRLVICAQPCQPALPGAKSLHWLGKPRDLSRFWTLFHYLRVDMKFDHQL